ncbi:MAG TPA: carboxypeptidase-like regulatory domain-containing protein, partial [Bacteroidia bacterium]|nr:carboxypeptidase-like regulatory domain-containing protein [Bacteroidia bacterium]
MRLLLSCILLLSIIFFIPYFSLDYNLQDLIGHTTATIFVPYAQADTTCVASCGDCNQHGGTCGGSSSSCPVGAPVLCNFPTPNCNILTCGGWVEPFDTCNANNDYKTCAYTAYTGGGTCIRIGAPDQYMTTNNCGGPHVCQGGVCIPWCTTFTCGAWTTPANTCYANNQSRTCTYDGPGTCIQHPAPTEYQTVNNCGGPHVCQGGNCIPWCTTETCGAWVDPSNSCSNNNSYRYCTNTGPATCIQNPAPTQYRTVNTCTGPHDCRGGVCIPWCTSNIVCGPWTNPPNSCSTNNSSRTCTYTGPGTCDQTPAPTEYQTVNTCTGPHDCRGGVCIPWCTTNPVYGVCDHIGVNTTCSPNNAYETGNYTGPGICDQIAAPNLACTLNTCTSPTWGCEAGVCIEYWEFSGTVTDPYNGNAGVGGVTITVNGYSTQTAGDGTYLIPYTAHIHAGTYAVTLKIPAGWTNTTVTTQNVTVGPNATGI